MAPSAIRALGGLAAALVAPAVAGAQLRGTVGAPTGGTAFGARTDARTVASDVSFRAAGWPARGNATRRLTPLDELQAFAFYRAPQNTEAGRQRPSPRFRPPRADEGGQPAPGGAPGGGPPGGRGRPGAAAARHVRRPPG